MKNATAYEKKIRKFISGAAKVKPSVPENPFQFIVEAILQADSSRKTAKQIVQAINEEFVDYNELRVAPVKDITDCMGRDFLFAREKAESIIKALNGIFDHSSSLSLAHLEKMPKRDLRKHLGELGLSPYAASLVLMVLFGGHAAAVDRSLVILLEQDGYISPGSELDDVQGFLERIVSQKDNLSVHEFFRDYVEKNLKSIAKKLKQQAVLAEAAAAAAAQAAAAPAAIPLIEAEESMVAAEFEEEEGEGEKPAAASAKEKGKEKAGKNAKSRPAVNAKAKSKK